ncbi:hypothetical protein TcCL_ESM12358 [Trypanosoma cruzi]|nr:hypothetical protein TcCL_ESM12358 [Trypanosoma cruzi]
MFLLQQKHDCVCARIIWRRAYVKYSGILQCGIEVTGRILQLWGIQTTLRLIVVLGNMMPSFPCLVSESGFHCNRKPPLSGRCDVIFPTVLTLCRLCVFAGAVGAVPRPLSFERPFLSSICHIGGASGGMGLGGLMEGRRIHLSNQSWWVAVRLVNLSV